MSKKIINLNFLKSTVLGNHKLEAFTNSFVYHDTIYSQKNIGSLFGIIQVSDNSEQSEYIPNLLTNLIKKEFYAQPKRSTEESFEAGLKKANLALADLAEHDILKWNNNLHGIVGVFKDNKFYFTQVGSAMIFLGRDNKIINLSEPSLNTNVHPVKTFRDIVVGEINPNDKIIIATPTIRNIFKLNDLDRLFNTFKTKEFDNLIIKTIKKEGSNVGIIIVNIKEKKKKISENTNSTDSNQNIEELIKNKNFLGEKINKKKTSTTTKTITKKEPSIKIPKEKKEALPKKLKNSHTKNKKNEVKNAPIKKESATRSENPPLTSTAKAKFDKKKTSSLTNKNAPHEKNTLQTKNNISKTKKILGKNKHSNSKNNTLKNKSKTLPKKNLGTKKFTGDNKSIKKLNDLKPSENITSTKKDVSPFEETPEIYISDDEDNLKKAQKNIPSKKLKKYFESVTKTNPSKASKKIHPGKNNISLKGVEIINKLPIKLTPLITNVQQLPEIFQELLNKLLKKSSFFLTKIKTSPSAENSTKKNTKTNYHKNRLLVLFKKYYLILFLILFLILTPLFIAWQHKKHSAILDKKPNENIDNPTLIKNKKITNKNNTQIFAVLDSNLKFISESPTTILAYGEENKLYEIDKNTRKKQTITIPKNTDIKNLKSITYMSSLNLFFLSSNKKVISYSATTKKFYSNKINLPDNFDLLDQGVYLDYLYLLDRNSKQIYRYPRDTGGFGNKKNWLKTPLRTTKNITAMALDDNIRLAYSDGTIEKYFKNKLIDTKKFEAQKITDIYTQNNLQNYYILDTASGKIMSINKKTNEIVREYQNNALTKTNNFTVDEKNKKIYLLNNKNILTISL